MLTGRDNAVIFDPSQVFKLIQISEPDRALIADAPKLLIERDALQARVKELEAQKSVLEEQRDMAKDELSMHGGTLVERIRKLKDEWAKIHRERDHANMVAEAAAQKIEELEAQRVPNPGVVGTLRDKNALLAYKDTQMAELREQTRKALGPRASGPS